MSLSNLVTLEWGDGNFPFALNGKQIEELQKVCAPDGKALGFGAIYQRVALGVWLHQDIYHTIRLGLIGGGMGAVEAKRKADMYAEPPYRAGQVGGSEQTALAILGAAMHGLETLPPGEAATPKTPSTSGKSEQGSSSTE